MRGNPGEDRPGLRVRRRLAHRPACPGRKGGGGACQAEAAAVAWVSSSPVQGGSQHMVAAAEERGKGEDR